MTISEIRKAFKLEVPNTEIFIKDDKTIEQHYNDIYVQWLEKKLADFLTS